jgi:hypothetical protein
MALRETTRRSVGTACARKDSKRDLPYSKFVTSTLRNFVIESCISELKGITNIYIHERALCSDLGYICYLGTLIQAFQRIFFG